MFEENITKNLTFINLRPVKQIDDRVLIVQVLVGIFLCINCLLIYTFFKKEVFHTNTRYIFFVHTLVCDSIFLFMTNLLLLLSFYRISMPAGLCIIICIMTSILTFATPLTLTAMSLERYVAICMPLRHAELSTPQRALCCVLAIHVLSFIQSAIMIFVASFPVSFYTTSTICTVEMFIIHSWQGHLRSAVTQFYFLVMSSTILYTYIRIMKVFKKASTEKQKSVSKGLQTVILHGVQLFLCLIQLWTPFVESAVLQISLDLFVSVRYFNYVAFILTPRCLSPLIYGLRDEQFYCAFKFYVLCGFNKKISPAVD